MPDGQGNGGVVFQRLSVMALEESQFIALNGLLAFAANFTEPEEVLPGVDIVELSLLPEHQPRHMLLEITCL